MISAITLNVMLTNVFYFHMKIKWKTTMKVGSPDLGKARLDVIEKATKNIK